MLLSPALFERATGGAIFRRGVWHGPRTPNPWEMYDTLTAEVHAASDHAAIYADLDRCDRELSAPVRRASAVSGQDG